MMHWSDKSASHPNADCVTVTVPTWAELLQDIEKRLVSGRGFTLATLNLDHVVKLRRDAAFRDAYLKHTHVTADGNPIVWLSRVAGQRLELVPGSEMILPMSELAARHQVPVALFGSTQDSLDAAAAALQTQCKGLKIAATIAPPMGFDPTGASAREGIKALKASGAGLCFLALGAPKQEIFAAYAAEQLPGMGFLSIGAGLDFVSGNQVRAPRIVQQLAAEWLWRMAQDPKRLAQRYGACFRELPGLYMQARRQRKQGLKGPIT